MIGIVPQDESMWNLDASVQQSLMANSHYAGDQSPHTPDGALGECRREILAEKVQNLKEEFLELLTEIKKRKSDPRNAGIAAIQVGSLVSF